MTVTLRLPVRRVTLLLAALLAVLTPGLLTATASAAATPEPPAERWAVSPADEEGPDGRRAVEHTLDPGESVTDRIAVRNVGQEPVTFELTAADGFYTRTGRFDTLAPGEESVAAGTWISIPESVTVEAGETEVVEFTVTVPERTEPGDHAAGITASVTSVQAAEDGTNVGVVSRIGVRVLTRVTGEVTPAAALEGVVTRYDLSWNPARPGHATVTFEVHNEGNTRLFAEGTVDVGGREVTFPAADQPRQELLPGDTREITVEVDDVWPLVRVPVTVTLVPEVATMDGTSSTLEPVVAESAVWAVPWPQLLVLLGLALLVGAVVQGRRRSRRRLESLLEQAREEGRRAATGAPSDPA